MTDAERDALVNRYAAGEMTALDVRRVLGITYGQLFQRVAELGLSLPRVQRAGHAAEVDKARRWMFPRDDG